MKAIFLDRDNTLIVDKPYTNNASDIEYFSFAKQALKIMQENGFELFLITNQSAIGRGMCSKADVEGVHAQMQRDLIKWGLRPFKDISYCPHSPADDCECRKPKPKMILDLIDKYKVNKSESYMVGDKIIDARCGENAGILGILIKQREEGFTCYDDILNFANSL